MDSKLFFTTFVMIFLAEIGDKTQLTALSISANSKSTYTVLLAVVLALSLAGGLGVLAGRVLTNYIPPEVIRYSASLLFILIGLLMLVKK